jgi:hypothetical protein
MTTVRLDSDIELKLDQFSSYMHRSKSEIIKQALEEYLSVHLSSDSPYDLGKELFGKYSSNDSDNSISYKNKLKGKLSEKYNH